ncbi:BnaCnng63290D [Brassica napus]|uniref:(rape) hypothetical protein n=1 Tax=Brassica napus TaxID=3708 RepID=A0A078JP92_BRANA|nr:unnamed protein product [Brassica napus]CDY69388.1 BnaCnng63290D [Brassica napus]
MAEADAAAVNADTLRLELKKTMTKNLEDGGSLNVRSLMRS